MAVHVSAYMICKTCGRQLDKLQQGNGPIYWGHAVELIGKADHEAVPVEYDESILVSVCDFCRDEVPLAHRHFLPVNDYSINVEVVGGRRALLQNRGGFNACDTCAALLLVHDWDGLVERYLSLHPGTDPNILQMLWSVVRDQVQGPVRKWLPGDELSGGDD